MISKVTGYALIFATVLVFNLITIVVTSVNSTLSQFGVYLFVPAIFLIAPSYLSKSSSIIVIFINGLFLDYHCNLPLGFNVFLFLFVFLSTLESFNLSANGSNYIDKRSLLLMVNALFFVILFLLIKFKVFTLSEWILSRFFVDLLLSSIVIFFISNPLMRFLEQLGERIINLGTEKNHI
ncbi:MAG: hypothetical protein CMI24_03790 [Opitutae bacterium]|nr:hypothetical protein [Opitutae bacterium]